ncbi:CRAL-TRIO domain-containing protein [Leucosporidium creatinivorum]|uniref:CRAL-TRIO domain-containing protein n=1 Tax=Leucosporidium creatinivorum TaxID=106004 RepID=A0A1Y2FJZ0_9BASI|nr:CRAL-TRIO domain-containing protein [Leucosporidium creatinivorum]
MTSVPLSPTTTRDPLAGHIAHLTASQTSALDAFKTRLTGAGHYTPAKDSTHASHDDVTLVRFLRARKFDVEGAFAQFTTTETWRKKEAVDTLFDEFPIEEFETSQQVYTQYTGRRTKSGQPLYVYKVGALTKERVNEYSKKADRLEPRMIVLSEMMTAFALPLCTSLPRPNTETPIDSTVCIVDVANVSLTRFWQLKGHMQRASTMATAHYPETLGAIYLVGAPNFFSTVWSWVCRWFDQGTVDKIFILSSHEVLPTLLKYIDASNIPKRYGGELDWDFGDPVSLDDESKKALGLDVLPRGPVRFTEREGFRPMGSGRSAEELKDEEERKKRVAEQKPKANGSAVVDAAAPAVAVPVAAAEAVAITNGKEEVTSDSDDDGEDIWAAAREVPGSPIKDLAAKLEGSTL